MCWAWNLFLTPQVMTKRPPGSSEDFLQYLLLLFFPFDFSYSTASSLLNLDPWFGVGIFCWTFGWTHGCLRASKEWSTSDRSWSLFGSQMLEWLWSDPGSWITFLPQLTGMWTPVIWPILDLSYVACLLGNLVHLEDSWLLLYMSFTLEIF